VRGAQKIRKIGQGCTTTQPEQFILSLLTDFTHDQERASVEEGHSKHYINIDFSDIHQSSDMV
jgi:hypothetical protein